MSPFIICVRYDKHERRKTGEMLAKFAKNRIKRGNKENADKLENQFNSTWIDFDRPTNSVTACRRQVKLIC